MGWGRRGNRRRLVVCSPTTDLTDSDDEPGLTVTGDLGGIVVGDRESGLVLVADVVWALGGVAVGADRSLDLSLDRSLDLSLDRSLDLSLDSSLERGGFGHLARVETACIRRGSSYIGGVV